MRRFSAGIWEADASMDTLAPKRLPLRAALFLLFALTGALTGAAAALQPALLLAFGLGLAVFIALFLRLGLPRLLLLGVSAVVILPPSNFWPGSLTFGPLNPLNLTVFAAFGLAFFAQVPGRAGIVPQIALSRPLRGLSAHSPDQRLRGRKSVRYAVSDVSLPDLFSSRVRGYEPSAHRHEASGICHQRLHRLLLRHVGICRHRVFAGGQLHFSHASAPADAEPELLPGLPRLFDNRAAQCARLPERDPAAADRLPDAHGGPSRAQMAVRLGARS